LRHTSRVFIALILRCAGRRPCAVASLGRDGGGVCTYPRMGARSREEPRLDITSPRQGCMACGCPSVGDLCALAKACLASGLTMVRPSTTENTALVPCMARVCAKHKAKKVC